MKMCPVGTEFFHAYGRTDMTNLMVAFNSFANAPDKDCYMGKENNRKILTLWLTREVCVSTRITS
jgi:hypothetical protein